jgi:hypothetical protein
VEANLLKDIDRIVTPPKVHGVFLSCAGLSRHAFCSTSSTSYSLIPRTRPAHLACSVYSPL